MIIRPIKKSDIKSASKIIGRNYSKRWMNSSTKELMAAFENKVIPPRYIVAEEKGKILGFAGYIQSWMDYSVYNIFWVNVDPKYQNKGIGTNLVQHTIKEIKNIRGKDKKASMILLTSTNPQFYKKRFGFKNLAKLNGTKYTLMSLDIIKE